MRVAHVSSIPRLALNHVHKIQDKINKTAIKDIGIRIKGIEL